MPNLRPGEILLIVLVVLLLFGAKRLPDLAKSVGKSLKILKTEVKDLGDDDSPAPTTTPVASAPVPVPPATTIVPPSVVSDYRTPVNHVQTTDDADRKQV